MPGDILGYVGLLKRIVGEQLVFPLLCVFQPASLRRDRDVIISNCRGGRNQGSSTKSKTKHKDTKNRGTQHRITAEQYPCWNPLVTWRTLCSIDQTSDLFHKAGILTSCPWIRFWGRGRGLSEVNFIHKTPLKPVVVVVLYNFNK